MPRWTRLVFVATLVAGFLSCTLLFRPGLAKDKETRDNNTQQKAADPAVERARKTVRMLDDIYKTTVVLITDKYVNDEDDFPAGSAAIALFDAINMKGWHEVKLLDATGNPFDPDNVAQDEFEREAVKQLKSGKDYYEQIVEIDGARKLRAATAIPVVMQKCIMCHPHYEDAKEGEAIGLLSYKLPIE